MQHDILHCSNEQCSVKEHCYRWNAYQEAVKLNLPRISCAIIDEDVMADGMCLLFWEHEKQR